jgi:hypothetical protein
MEILEIVSALISYVVAGISILFVVFLGVAKLGRLLGVAPKEVEKKTFLDNFL